LFSNAQIEVAPTDEPGMQVAAKHTYQGYQLCFGLHESDMMVIAVRDGKKLELLPPRLLKDRFPVAFFEDYFHWYDHDTNEIEFRPRADPWISSTTHWKLTRNGTTWRLTKGQLTLTGFASTTSRTLAAMLSPLEIAGHIITTFDSSCRSVIVELHRTKLGFYFEQGKQHLHSKQYRGMSVDPDQRLYSLQGLSNKLVLRNEQKSERMVLIPEGAISFRKGINFTSVHIDPDTYIKVHAYQIDNVLGRILDNGSLRSKLCLAYLYALTSHCLPDPLTGHTGTEMSLSILRSAAVRSFSLLTKGDTDLLVKMARLSPGRVYQPRERTVMQKVTWTANLPALSQDSGFSLTVKKIFHHARQMKLFHAEEVYVEPDQIDHINRTLFERDNIRSSTFRVDGFGAEQYSKVHDATYEPRAKLSDVARGQRAYIAASLILRDDGSIHSTLVAKDLKQTLAQDILGNSPVRGADALVNPAELRYDAGWLESLPSFLPKLWCNLHSSLAISSEKYSRFDIMMWLSTAAFGQSADLGVIQTLAALYKCPELATVVIPSFKEISLSRGETVSLEGIKSRLAQKSLWESPDYRLPRKDRETNNRYSRRRTKAFETNLGSTTQVFAKALVAQWPCESPTKPTIANAEEYLNTSSAMINICRYFKDITENVRFGVYLTQLSEKMSRQKVLAVSIPHIRAVHCPTSGSGSDTERFFGVSSIFALQAPTPLEDCKYHLSICA
jgi:hypothetical protein